MSTRSGKRIQISLHENIMKSETDFTRSERKTRSKHANDHFVEINASAKQKKRNYVAYPADDDAGVDTVDSKNDEKKTRVLRNNVLKEHNVSSSTATVELAVDTGKSKRSTRRTRKYDENSQDATEVTSRDEEPKVEVSKPKKGKKKKNKAEQVEVKVAVSKKKSKKKKDRRSGSMVVEDIEIEIPSALNKSNMSVDSFHSAAGSPRNIDNCNEVVPLPQKQLGAVNTNSKNVTNKAEARKTRSSMKLDNTSTKDHVTEEEPMKRKSIVKVNLDSNLKNNTFPKENDNIGNQDKTPNRDVRKRKSSFKDVTVSEDMSDENSEFEKENLRTSTKKSVRNATFDKTVTPTKMDTTMEPNENKICLSHKKTIGNEDLKLTAEENAVNKTFERDSFSESGRNSKKRKSAFLKLSETNSPLKTGKSYIRKSVVNEAIEDVNNDKKKSICDATFSLTESSSLFKGSPMKLFKEETKRKSVANITYQKDSETDSEAVNATKQPLVNETFDLLSSPFKSASEASSPIKMIDDFKRKSVINTTYDKDSDTDQEIKNNKPLNTTFDKDSKETKINTTFEKDTTEKTDIKNKRTSLQLSAHKVTNKTETIDINQEKKLDTTFDKYSESSSLISSDNSMITMDKSNGSRISITSDESKNEENILNTTPVLIESSMDESIMNTKTTPTKETTPLKTESLPPVTPLKREGTFTKDEPEVIASPKPKVSLTRTPTKRMSLPSPGFTPFHVNKSSSKEKSVLLNVTRSIEKRRSSLAEPPRTTKVMFCSPVNNPALLTQNRRKVIKSNLKGSNKSFVFDESVSLETRPANRKRSYTQSDVEDDARVKRKRLAGEMQLSVDRLSRPRTSSASAKLAEPTTPSKKPTTPSKKSDAKLPRTKLPNFAAMHQKQFAKMESLDECQERKARRAKQLLTPTGAVNVLERISPKDKAAESENPKDAPEKSKEPPKKPETPIKSLPTFKSLNSGFTRFGFKLNLDVNPFSIPSKAQPKPKENKPNGLSRQATLPSMAGATSARREVAKQTVMREKSFTERRNVQRTSNRTIIKGVRTNRRFELQMRMRDL